MSFISLVNLPVWGRCHRERLNASTISCSSPARCDKTVIDRYFRGESDAMFDAQACRTLAVPCALKRRILPLALVALARRWYEALSYVNTGR